MNYIRPTHFIIILLLILLSPGSSKSADEEGKSLRKELPVEIAADSIRFDDDGALYIAEGNVEISQSGVTLKADTVTINMEKGHLSAFGNLLGSDEGGNELRADSLEMDINRKKAVLIKGKLFFKINNIYIESEELRKTGPQSYEAGLTTFTSCECDESAPVWSISTRSSTVTVGEYFRGWHALFRIKGVPVIYLPYIKAPVNRARQSGFLLPSPGYSDVGGVTLDTAFFWAIGASTDASFYLDFETLRGRGYGLEFRHYRSIRAYSELFFYYYTETDIDRVREFREGLENLSRPLTAGSDRWRLNFTHNESLPHGLKLRADVNLVSDDEYFIDFEDSSDKRSIESIESTVSITKNWDHYSLVAEFRHFDNLLDADDEEVLQILPQITFTTQSRKLFWSPFYISLDTSFTNFVRKSGDDGQRFDLEPRLSLPMRPGEFLELTPSFAPRWTKYRINDDTGSRTPQRLIYEFRTDLVTTFVRNFKESLGSTGPLRHTIRPALSYRYVPNIIQDELTSFDSVDHVEAANELQYSFNTTLSYRYTVDGLSKRQEYLYFDLREIFDIRELRRSLSGPDDDRRPFRAINAELRFSPVERASLTVDLAYDPYEASLQRYDTSLRYRDRRGDSLYVAYRYDRVLDISYLESSVRLQLLRSLGVTIKKRYSFDEERSLETRVSLEFEQQCWGALLTYKKSPEEELFIFRFSLKSLGSVGRQGGM